MDNEIHLTRIILLTALACLLLIVVGNQFSEAEEEKEIDCRPAASFGGSYVGLDLDGNLLYAAHYSGFDIFDITDPVNPEKLSSTLINGEAVEIDVHGDTACIAAGPGGFVIFDVSDPGNPRYQGSCDFWGEVLDVAVLGDHAFLALEDLIYDDEGLVIMDISDRTNPRVIGRYPIPGNTCGVFVDGDNAFMTASNKGLYILDIANRSHPVKVSVFNTRGYARDVIVTGDTAYVADYSGGMVILDVTDRGDPIEAGTYDPGDTIRAVAVDGDHAYLSAESAGLIVLDVSDPSQPTERSTHGTHYADDILVSGNVVYGCDYQGIVVVDVSDPENPLEIGSHREAGNVAEVVIDGDTAYLADYNRGLVIVDVSNRSTPRYLGSCDGMWGAWGLAVDDGYAYMACSENGLIIANVSDPSRPTVLGQYDSPGEARAVSVSGNYAYLADYGRGLVIVNVTDRKNPVKESSWSNIEKAEGVTVDGEYVYVCEPSRGNFFIIDVTDKAHPDGLSHLDTTGAPKSISVIGDELFLAAGWQGLIMVDAGDKEEPVETSSFDLGGSAEDITVVGDHAYLALGASGLGVVDIGNRSAPGLMIEYMTYRWARGVAVSGDWVFLATSQKGLLILEIGEIPEGGILTVSPNPAFETQDVKFEGTASAPGSGTIAAFSWRSSKDGVIGNDEAFTTSNLSAGNHTIFLKVMDDRGFWSREVNTTLAVREMILSEIDLLIAPLSGEIGPGAVVTVNGSVTITPPQTPDSLTLFLFENGTTFIFSEEIALIDGNFSHEFALPENLSEGTHTMMLELELANGQTRAGNITIAYLPVADTDDDGTEDAFDAFPYDPAASKDTDGDGYPDEWNPGMTEVDSTTGLKLDKYPNDPKKWEVDSDGDGGLIPGFELIVLFVSIGIIVGIKRKRNKP